MNEPRFIHLRVHSDYSIVDGITKINLLIKKALDIKMPALAITDFTNLFGLIKFYNYSIKCGIKPIIGSDFLIKNEILGNDPSEITILASNNIGYQNLILLISDAYKIGYEKNIPFIKQDWLIKYREGLILISGDVNGDIGKCLIKNNLSKLEKCIFFYKNYFLNNFYLGVVKIGREEEDFYLECVIKLSKQYSIPIVATNNVRFANKHDFDAHKVRVAINKKITFKDEKYKEYYSSQQYMKNEEEMCELFSDLPEALKNSVEIAKRCNVTIKTGEYYLPKFHTGGSSIEDYLIKCSTKGLEKRLVSIFPEINLRNERRLKYEKRLNSELQVINKMGFPGYFLIVMEFVQWAKKNNIPVGPGRGSGAGSLVAYCLEITDIDPIPFNLIFERFLNPERLSMPDFDIDFCMEGRDLVIDHVSKTYGHEKVSQIITFGTMAARASIRDVGRVLGYPYSFVDRIAKLIPLDIGIKLKNAFITEPKLQEIYNSDEEVKLLVDMSYKLEGVIRNAGKHAGGLVISPTKITDFSPLFCDSTPENIITQFDKSDIEKVGLVKFDFLGLRTLTVINRCIKMINKKNNKYGLNRINISNISLEDEKSFKKLRNAETIGVFQLESHGIRELIKRLKPNCFEDIVALIALFRPGPLQSGMVDNFINRKHGKENIYYPDIKWQHSLLKPILKSTYGIILYQEQVMQIAQALAGYTLEKADILRRAMGKKKPDEMSKQRSIFEEGAEKNGINRKLSIKIFDLMEKFSGYGFNKSHSVAYALISYQTLWLKTHYASEFMAASMSVDIENNKKIARLFDECLRLGIKVNPPNINESKYYFNVDEDNNIIYGMGAIKGIGKESVKIILKEREENGHFSSLLNFCSRMKNKKINSRIIERLIISGSFRCLDNDRLKLINSIDTIIKASNQFEKLKDLGQKDIFEKMILKDSLVVESNNLEKRWSEESVLEAEHKILGVNFNSYSTIENLCEIKCYTNGIRLKDISIDKKGKFFTIAGIINSLRIVNTKKNKKIGICTLNDDLVRLEVIFFENILEKYAKFLKIENLLIVNGKVEIDDFDKNIKILARKLMDINLARINYMCRVVIFLNEKQTDSCFINRIKSSLKESYSGIVPVYFYYKNRIGKTLKYKFKYKINPTDALLSDLKNIVGIDQVKLEIN